MKTEIINIIKTGYGHWKVTIHYRNGKQYTCITTNSQLIDWYKNSDIFTNKDYRNYRHARKYIIAEAKRKNNLPD
jgi:hypothetical protein